jgi:hypothetical protein
VALELIVVTADLHINLPERTPFFQGAFQCPSTNRGHIFGAANPKSTP